jgi:hypothetical protein
MAVRRGAESRVLRPHDNVRRSVGRASAESCRQYTSVTLSTLRVYFSDVDARGISGNFFNGEPAASPGGKKVVRIVSEWAHPGTRGDADFRVAAYDLFLDPMVFQRAADGPEGLEPSPVSGCQDPSCCFLCQLPSWHAEFPGAELGGGIFSTQSTKMSMLEFRRTRWLVRRA